MPLNAKDLIDFSLSWLSDSVFPLWIAQGFDPNTNGFVEGIGFDGKPLAIPRRAMVQSRQVYSFVIGAKLKVCPKKIAESNVKNAAQYLIDRYQQKDGSFVHSINIDGSVKNSVPELYTQAFSLFGLAQAFQTTGNQDYKERALSLINYLQNNRKLRNGGFSEIGAKGEILYCSNPHMHLFEGALAWMQVDSHQAWKEIADEILSVCLKKFIHPSSNFLGEYFDENWNPLIENGRFIFEPGHQYEWAWLFSWYQDLTGRDLRRQRHQLFFMAEKHGVSRSEKIVFDEVWSDCQPKSQSSRFWPQCERIKAAVRLGLEVEKDQQKVYAEAADEAFNTLLRFFKTPQPGLWFDMVTELGDFKGDTAKASSLYHIINAIDEYSSYRPKLVNF
jgi:mannose/cellobiose epimerase-like protein (N-acyl-D-glucosamine 2-epimerase family)